jgi:hypothetical protein
MTRSRATATTATIVAAMLAASLSGAALAGEPKRNQTQGTTSPNTVTSGQGNNTSNSLSTWAAVNAYQVARKCLDNILPECPKK